MRRTGLSEKRCIRALLIGLTVICTNLPILRAEPADPTRYASPEELKPGMKGFGRTVMSGSRIETFQIEIIGLMRNAYYAKQDVILVRCSGLNLEHSGIIGGMSGSPCYIKDDDGRERMIGAVAYGWSFNKDPICGVQPITQMLPIPDVRTPARTVQDGKAQSAPARESASGKGYSIGEVIARTWAEPIEATSRFSIFNEEIERLATPKKPGTTPESQLRPLLTPVMVSGVSAGGFARLRDRFERLGLQPVASGGASSAVVAESADVKLEPGSVLCIPFMTGDIMMEGLGTCTEVIGDRVLGFGHSMFSEGSVQLPLATGVVHTVIPSVMRSNKIGAALKSVGTLLGDENSGIFGLRGDAPRSIPVDVAVTDIRGRRTYHFEMVQEENFTPLLLGTAAMESIYAHSDPPKEHTINYAIETEFENLGTFKSVNMSSQSGAFGVAMDASLPTMALMNAPFGKAKVVRARIEATIVEKANTAQIEQARPDRQKHKPGDTVSVRVRWRHYRHEPLYTEADYAIALPADLPDGEYTLTMGSASSFLSGLRSRKPHLFRVDSLAELLAGFNLLSAYPDNKLYMSVELPTGGVAVDRTEMPHLPSFRRQILASTRRTDLNRYTDAVTAEHETAFVVSGSAIIKLTVSRRADQ